MEYIPIILVLLTSSPDWIKYEAQYKTGYNIYIECKQSTLTPLFKEILRMLLEDSEVVRVKSGCEMKWRSSRLGAKSI